MQIIKTLSGYVTEKRRSDSSSPVVNLGEPVEILAKENEILCEFRSKHDATHLHRSLGLLTPDTSAEKSYATKKVIKCRTDKFDT